MENPESKWRELFGSEWDWIKRLGSAIRDPEEKKVFWKTIKAKKLADQKYSIYTDFPRSDNVNRRAMEECMEFVKSLRHMGEDDVGKDEGEK